MNHLDCDCLNAVDRELSLHPVNQDESCDGWKHLLELVDEAAAKGWLEFVPRDHLTADEWLQIVTLPPTIAKLKRVKSLMVYGSNLVRIPPEIGEMESLEEFTPYTSYRLHWLPYEIRHCPNLKDSCISTRALYGNYKSRLPFPDLDHFPYRTDSCSVCGGDLAGLETQNVWITLEVGTDILPLLVCACSEECVGNLPAGPEDFVRHPHRGGLGVEQPTTTSSLFKSVPMADLMNDLELRKEWGIKDPKPWWKFW